MPPVPPHPTPPAQQPRCPRGFPSRGMAEMFLVFLKDTRPARCAGAGAHGPDPAACSPRPAVRHAPFPSAGGESHVNSCRRGIRPLNGMKRSRGKKLRQR
ncbi:hypothetical protein SHJG_0454 [Streptomyces hygroscopicus subsp. jinggangensis 5008]|nr:hypothetical protein SHJG_0454 [Streptomyces hygroscopicus subsp. jinggangensis 5008]